MSCIEFHIEIKAPALDSCFVKTVDPEPYYNPSAQAFILEQPTKTALRSLPAYNRKTGNNLLKLGHTLRKLNVSKRRSMKGMEYRVKRNNAAL